MLPSVEQRLLSRIEIGDDCWEWQGRREKRGYGVLDVGGRPVRTHRLAYELFVGVIPEEKVLHHICENKSCARYDHLELTTRSDHMNVHRKDFSTPRRRHTHCKRGHSFTDDNSILIPSRGRHGGFTRLCRTCRKASKKGRKGDHKPFAAMTQGHLCAGPEER